MGLLPSGEEEEELPAMMKGLSHLFGAREDVMHGEAAANHNSCECVGTDGRSGFHAVTPEHCAGKRGAVGVRSRVGFGASIFQETACPAIRLAPCFNPGCPRVLAGVSTCLRLSTCKVSQPTNASALCGDTHGDGREFWSRCTWCALY